MTQQNTALVEETTSAAETMSSEAASLRQKVSIFRLNLSYVCNNQKIKALAVTMFFMVTVSCYILQIVF